MMLKRKKNEGGLTLIELIMVIVILGIMSAVAIPRFLNLAGSARLSSARGVASAVNASIQSEHADLLISGTAYNLADVLSATAFGGGISFDNGSVAEPAVNEVQISAADAEFELNLGGNIFTWSYTDVTTDDVPALIAEVSGGGGFN